MFTVSQIVLLRLMTQLADTALAIFNQPLDLVI
jgi:hypothetical protein